MPLPGSGSTRTEHDVLGGVEMPADAPHGAPTTRALRRRSEESNRRLHDDALVLDGHIDLGPRLIAPTWRFTERHAPPASPGADGSHMDLPRMREAGIDGAFFAVFVSGALAGERAVNGAREQIAAIRRTAEDLPQDLALCTTAAGVRSAARDGKVAVLIGIEGGHMIGDDLDVVREFARAGARYLTLTHTVNVTWADSSFDVRRSGGLTPFGRDVVGELNRLGVMVDVSHVSDATFWDALAASRAPVIASHSSCRALCSTPRNLTDEMIVALAKSGGWMGINFMSVYLHEDGWQACRRRMDEIAALGAEVERSARIAWGAPDEAEGRRAAGDDRRQALERALKTAKDEMAIWPSVPWTRIVEHIDYAVSLVGADHVGLGPDFYDCAMPAGMEDCTGVPKITEALLARGYREADVEKILGRSLLRVMEHVERVGSDLRGGHVT